MNTFRTKIRTLSINKILTRIFENSSILVGDVWNWVLICRGISTLKMNRFEMMFNKGRIVRIIVLKKSFLRSCLQTQFR